MTNEKPGFRGLTNHRPFSDMKVMLTPPDLWGSTGYVSQSGADASDTMYKVSSEHVKLVACSLNNL